VSLSGSCESSFGKVKRSCTQEWFTDKVTWMAMRDVVITRLLILCIFVTVSAVSLKKFFLLFLCLCYL